MSRSICRSWTFSRPRASSCIHCTRSARQKKEAKVHELKARLEALRAEKGVVRPKKQIEARVVSPLFPFLCMHTHSRSRALTQVLLTPTSDKKTLRRTMSEATPLSPLLSEFPVSGAAATARIAIKAPVARERRGRRTGARRSACSLQRRTKKVKCRYRASLRRSGHRSAHRSATRMLALPCPRPLRHQTLPSFPHLQRLHPQCPPPSHANPFDVNGPDLDASTFSM
jgi:hypothetical protein